MDSNEEIAKDLQPRTSRLVDLLKRLDKKTIEHQKEDTTAYMSDLIGSACTFFFRSYHSC